MYNVLVNVYSPEGDLTETHQYFQLTEQLVDKITQHSVSISLVPTQGDITLSIKNLDDSSVVNWKITQGKIEEV